MHRFVAHAAGESDAHSTTEFRYDPLAEDKFSDHCGIVGIAADRPVAPYIYYGLQALQHRGQESAGIVTLDGFEYRQHKGMGLVDANFNPRRIEKLGGLQGIGHVRYSTSAGSTEDSAQPQLVMGAGGGIALAHNGNIPNTQDLLEELQGKGWAFYSNNDTEVIVRLLANLMTKHDNDPVQAIKAVMERLEGAYCFAIMIGQDLFAVRDPWGIKPLCVGKFQEGVGHAVVSESVALDVMGADWIRDIEPGELVRITKDKIETVLKMPAAKPARCFFEYVYFARGDAFMDGRLNQEVRENIGHILWNEAPVEADIVVPVPDSGRSHANGLAQASGIRYAEALMKNRYVHRTFIMPTQESRELNVRLKVNPIKQTLEGKRVILVDDSIVRGTTMRRIVRMLRAAGAKEVHLRIGAPAIIAPCYLGIDMSTRDELIAANNTVEEICEHVGADSLAFISIPGIVEAIGFPADEMCLGCVDEQYPVPISGEKLKGGDVVPGERHEELAAM